ncbi:hypothetical protein [Planktothrix agardhii]|jgi:hypothetical protein|uniref:hypothetical protein n=1 Tax=Planktothrix agardhii TaxID=1160 RepID=UPI001D0A22DD|nr:hypothetical protein [Planktothrix agardhii]MCB8788995.1 hypothetical protein [Planktothrix agardhii 1025]MCF3614280.1 hypothetical protein [Planktothrix agardhii 1027]
MTKNRIILYTISFISAIALFLINPANAHACACCATAGIWLEYTNSLENYDVESLNKLQYSPTAKLVVGAAGFATIKGLASESETYTLSHSKNNRSWNFHFTDTKGKAGNLSFSLPPQKTEFGTDFYDKPVADNRLYKEVRLTGKLGGNGIFESGINNDSRYKLILQGRGGYCLDSHNFKHWILQISGPQSSYSFYGSFK